MTKHVFAIQCDRLRSRCENGEEIWLTIMANAERIEPEILLENCDTEKLIDEDESYEEYIGSDDSSGCYRSNLNGIIVYFIQTSGFEFFFTEDGLPPTYFEDVPQVVREMTSGGDQKLLSRSNSPFAHGSFGFEGEPELIDQDLEYIPGVIPRFRLLVNGEPVAGMQVENNTVSNLYVSMGERRNGCAAQIFNKVKNVLGELYRSEIPSLDGQMLIESLSKEADIDEHGIGR